MPSNISRATLTVPRHLPALLLWCASIMPTCYAAPPAHEGMTITYAEQPIRLVRSTAMFSAGRGVALQKEDMLASGASVIQLDAGGSTIAIGPESRIFIKHGGELVLLEGWLKIRGGGRVMTVNATVLQLASAGTTATLHVTPGASEVFAESGELPIDELAAGKVTRRTRLPSEQFAVRTGAQPLRILLRPPAPFLAAMPRSFLDVLVPVAARSPGVAPKRERALTYAELAPWLSEQGALRQLVQRRFDPPRPTRVAPVRPSTDQP